MIPQTLLLFCHVVILFLAIPTASFAQNSPYDVFPAADAPWYRARYDASTQPGELIFPVNYTVWILENAEELRSVLVPQDGGGRVV